MNIFINLFLVIMILLTKSTCFRKFFISYISRSSTFSRSNLNTYIAFQSFRTILQLNASEISFFYKGLCIFAILSINSLNFPKSNVRRIFLQNIFKKIGNVSQIFRFIFFVPVIWRFNAFCITVFFTAIIIMILALVFIVFTALFLSIFIKLSYIIGIFTQFSISICINLLFLGFFIILCLAACFYLSLHCSCVFLLMFYMFIICLLILTIMIHHQVVFLFSIFILILTKMLIAFKVIIMPLHKIFGYFFQPRFYF